MTGPDVFVHQNLMIVTEHRNHCIRPPMTCRNPFYQILDKWLKTAFWMNWNFFYLSIRIYMSIKKVSEEMDLSHCFLWLALALKTATPQTQQFHHVEKAVRVFTGMARCALGWGTEPATAFMRFMVKGFTWRLKFKANKSQRTNITHNWITKPLSCAEQSNFMTLLWQEETC